jgi:SOS-response transcriptional repressor LexA
LRIHAGRPGSHAARIELVPENPRFHTIVVEPPEELALLGRVIELRRHFDAPRRAPRR